MEIHERLTYSAPFARAWCGPLRLGVRKKQAFSRLAYYEDTGLAPEEITTEKPACVFYCNRKCNLDGDWCPEGPGCPKEVDSETAMRLLIPSFDAPLTLEELRKMNGEPVYVQYPGGGGERGLVGTIYGYDHIEICFKRGLENVVGMYGLFSRGAVIYRRKPETVKT